MFSKPIVNIVAAAAVLSLVSAGAASAAVMTWAPGDIGETQTVQFDGVSDAYFHHSIPVPGLSSELDLTLQSIVGNKWTFAYDLLNTSSSPVTASRVTVFGFDVLQPYAGVTSTGLFHDPGAGFTPIVGSHNLCFRTINFGQCIGSYFGGVSKGGSSSGLLSLKYTSALLALQLDNFFVAYQGVTAHTLCLCHQDGVGTGVVAPVPEPSTWAMMITGLGGLGAAMRRRRGLQAAA
jgi:hypothetical protein